MFNSGAAINVNRAPGIFRKVFEKRIPSRRPWLTLRLSHKCLQSLLSSWIKTVHRLVLHQLSPNCLDVRSNLGLLGKTSRVADSRDCEAEQDHDDAHHDHDLEEGEAGLIGSFCHFCDLTQTRNGLLRFKSMVGLQQVIEFFPTVF